ncbi:hypothetical protein VTK26DRAFT_2384 [Humicola hyalothermophila]
MVRERGVKSMLCWRAAPRVVEDGQRGKRNVYRALTSIYGDRPLYQGGRHRGAVDGKRAKRKLTVTMKTKRWGSSRAWAEGTSAVLELMYTECCWPVCWSGRPVNAVSLPLDTGEEIMPSLGRRSIVEYKPEGRLSAVSSDEARFTVWKLAASDRQQCSKKEKEERGSGEVRPDAIKGTSPSRRRAHEGEADGRDRMAVKR